MQHIAAMHPGGMRQIMAPGALRPWFPVPGLVTAAAPVQVNGDYYRRPFSWGQTGWFQPFATAPVGGPFALAVSGEFSNDTKAFFGGQSNAHRGQVQEAFGNPYLYLMIDVQDPFAAFETLFVSLVDLNEGAFQPGPIPQFGRAITWSDALLGQQGKLHAFPLASPTYVATPPGSLTGIQIVATYRNAAGPPPAVPAVPDAPLYIGSVRIGWLDNRWPVRSTGSWYQTVSAGNPTPIRAEDNTPTSRRAAYARRLAISALAQPLLITTSGNLPIPPAVQQLQAGGIPLVVGQTYTLECERVDDFAIYSPAAPTVALVQWFS